MSLTEVQRFWLSGLKSASSSGVDERPTFPQLLHLSVGEEKVNIIEQIGTRYYDFGIQILQDDTGAIMDTIVEECRGDVSAINRKILSRWIRGEGKQPVSWAALATELFECGLKELACTIRSVKSKC
jgi:hypothetical protein